MTETLQILLLAILQGITEFLPISSSAHLVFLQEILEKCGLSAIEETYTLGIVLHLASLLAILCYYWRPLLRLALGRDIPLLKLIIIGSLPVAIVGFGVKLFLDEFFEEKIFTNVPLVASLLWVTAGILYVGQKISMQNPHDRKNRHWRKNLKTLTAWRALGIGLAQAVAILPGISRSGSTITAGLAFGLKRNDAATFSFLLAIPAIGGAGLVEILKVAKEGVGEISIFPLFLGFFVCFIVSLLSLHLLIRLLRMRQIGIFAWYLIPMGFFMFLLGS